MIRLGRAFLFFDCPRFAACDISNTWYSLWSREPFLPLSRITPADHTRRSQPMMRPPHVFPPSFLRSFRFIILRLYLSFLFYNQPCRVDTLDGGGLTFQRPSIAPLDFPSFADLCSAIPDHPGLERILIPWACLIWQ